MKREEKRRKFNEAVLNMLYPPSPSPSQSEDEHSPVIYHRQGFNPEPNPVSGFKSLYTDGFEEQASSSPSDVNGEECQKLTRAQRKRLRKKKLKEDIPRRKQIIGPLLPLPTDAKCDGTPGVRSNAAVTVDSAIDNSDIGDWAGGTNQNKLKNRRIAKRLAKERLKSSDLKSFCIDEKSP